MSACSCNVSLVRTAERIDIAPAGGISFVIHDSTPIDYTAGSQAAVALDALTTQVIQDGTIGAVPIAAGTTGAPSMWGNPYGDHDNEGVPNNVDPHPRWRQHLVTTVGLAGPPAPSGASGPVDPPRTGHNS
jgi:hypothetical protein